jgi:hypothetical protein
VAQVLVVLLGIVILLQVLQQIKVIVAVVQVMEMQAETQSSGKQIGRAVEVVVLVL